MLPWCIKWNCLISRCYRPTIGKFFVNWYLEFSGHYTTKLEIFCRICVHFMQPIFESISLHFEQFFVFCTFLVYFWVFSAFIVFWYTLTYFNIFSAFWYISCISLHFGTLYQCQKQSRSKKLCNDLSKLRRTESSSATSSYQPSRWLWEKKNPTLVHLIQTKVDLGSLGHAQCTFLLVHATTSFSRHVNLCEPWAHSWVSNWAWVDYISSLIWTFE